MSTTTKTVADPLRIVIGPVRFSYLNLWKPSAAKGSTVLKYGGSFLFPKSDKETLKKIKDALNLAKEKGKLTKAGWKNTIPSKLRLPLEDGDESYPDDENYAGHWFLKATNNNQPGYCVKGKEETDQIEQSEFYSGAFGKISVSFFPYDNVSNGVGAQLNNIMKTKDGENLGGNVNIDAAEEFGEDDF